MVLCGTADSVADETFVVLNVFCLLDWSEVYLIDVHCHWIPRSFPGFRRGQNVRCSASEFPHLDNCIIELTSLMEPKFVSFWFLE